MVTCSCLCSMQSHKRQLPTAGSQVTLLHCEYVDRTHFIRKCLNIGVGRRGSSSPSDSPRGHQQPGGPLGTEAPHYDPSQGVPVGSGTEQDAEAAYHRLELLSQSIRNELQRDLHIHDSAVLPNFINLPQVCAITSCFFLSIV